MINIIADKIVLSLATLPFVDRITGVVKTLKYYGPDKKVISIPVAFNTDPQACASSQLNDYVPDSKKTSIIYFEDQGTSFVDSSFGYDVTSVLRLVCWFNHKKIGPQYNTSLIALNLLSHIPKKLGNFNNLIGVLIEVQRQEPNDGSAFSKYTYQEEISQYITYPYDYVSFIVQATYKVRTGCIDDLIPESMECNDPLTVDTVSVTGDNSPIETDQTIYK